MKEEVSSMYPNRFGWIALREHRVNVLMGLINKRRIINKLTFYYWNGR